MRIAGKQIPWWLLAGAAGVVIIMVVAVVLTNGAPDDKPVVGLPDSTQGPAEPSQNAPSTTGQTPGKSETTRAAGSPGGSSDDSDAGSSGGGTNNGDGEPEGEQDATNGSLVVKYWNDTTSKRPGAVEVLVGDVAWRPRATAESDSGAMRPVVLGEIQKLTVYPDGRDGERIDVQILMSRAMSGNERDCVHIELRDDRVRVLGTPVVGFEVTAARG